MKTIRISDEVWNAIAGRGRFGENEDIVLRRVFELAPFQRKIATNEPTTAETSSTNPKFAPPTQQPAEREMDSTLSRTYRWKQRRTEVRMFQTVQDGKLVLEFEGGKRMEWQLPPKEDVAAIRRVRASAIQWVRENDGTDGQVGAAMRALTSRGYHVTLKRFRIENYA